MVNTTDRCPGALHIVSARDGGLARIRIPGGILMPAQLALLGEISEQCADGMLDITARANIQIRGIRANEHAHFSALLAQAGLLRAASHDRVRNILMSPFSGIDPDEFADMRDIAAELDRALVAETRLAALPAKFSFGLDGGGYPVDLTKCEVGIFAARHAQREIIRIVMNGKATAFAYHAGALFQSPATAAKIMVDLATLLQSDPAPADETVLNTLRRAGPDLYVIPVDFRLPASDGQSLAPGRRPAAIPDRVNLLPLIPLGRLTARQSREISEVAFEMRAELRLAPWRGIVIGNLTATDAAAAAEHLERIGLSCDTANGYAGLHACAGSACDAALSDVRDIAAGVATALDGYHKPSGWHAKLAACPKRCAMRDARGLTLYAEPTGYTLEHQGTRNASALTAQAAISAICDIFHAEYRT